LPVLDAINRADRALLQRQAQEAKARPKAQPGGIRVNAKHHIQRQDQHNNPQRCDGAGGAYQGFCLGPAYRPAQLKVRQHRARRQGKQQGLAQAGIWQVDAVGRWVDQNQAPLCLPKILAAQSGAWGLLPLVCLARLAGLAQQGLGTRQHRLVNHATVEGHGGALSGGRGGQHTARPVQLLRAGAEAGVDDVDLARVYA